MDDEEEEEDRKSGRVLFFCPPPSLSLSLSLSLSFVLSLFLGETESLRLWTTSTTLVSSSSSSTTTTTQTKFEFERKRRRRRVIIKYDGGARVLSNAEGLARAKPLTTDAWVQCDACQVWRRVPNFVATKLGEHEQWFCHKNFHQEFSTCDDPQELIDDEIDVLMKAQEKENKRIQAEEIGRKILEEDEEDERELLGGTRGDEEEEEEEKKKKKKGGAGGWKKKKDFDESDDDEDAMCKPIGNAHVWSRVSRNIFKHREPRKLTEDDIMVCNCVIDPETGSGCGEECVNRLVLTECDPKFCPCSTACKNQRFSRKEFKGIEVKRSSKKGHGLFSRILNPGSLYWSTSARCCTKKRTRRGRGNTPGKKGDTFIS